MAGCVQREAHTCMAGWSMSDSRKFSKCVNENNCNIPFYQRHKGGPVDVLLVQLSDMRPRWCLLGT